VSLRWQYLPVFVVLARQLLQFYFLLILYFEIGFRNLLLDLFHFFGRYRQRLSLRRVFDDYDFG
jgi:hypothetical protein